MKKVLLTGLLALLANTPAVWAGRTSIPAKRKTSSGNSSAAAGDRHSAAIAVLIRSTI